MLKKYRLILLLLLFFIVCPKDVFAVCSNEIEYSCSDEVMVSGTVSCRIYLENSCSTLVKGIQANHQFNEAFSYVKTVSGTEWSIASAHSEGLMLTNVDGISKDSAMAQVDFLVSDQVMVGNEYEFQLHNVFLTDGTQDLKIDNKISKVKVLSILDVLESLTVNGKSLEVKDGITNYTVYLENNVDRTMIEAVLKSDKYQFDNEYGPREITGLKVGENEVKLKILSSDRELITITILLNRSANGEIIENISSNPKTGNFPILAFVGVMISSIGIFIYFQRKNSVKEG